MRNTNGTKLRQTVAGIFCAVLMTTVLVSNATSTAPVFGGEQNTRHATA